MKYMNRKPLSEADRHLLRIVRTEMNQAYDLINDAFHHIEGMHQPPKSLRADLERLRLKRIRIMSKFVRVKGFL